MTRGSAPVATTTCSAVCRAPSVLLPIPGLRELDGVWGTRDPRTLPLDLLRDTIQPFPSFSGNYDAALTELRMAIADDAAASCTDRRTDRQPVRIGRTRGVSTGTPRRTTGSSQGALISADERQDHREGEQRDRAEHPEGVLEATCQRRGQLVAGVQQYVGVTGGDARRRSRCRVRRRPAGWCSGARTPSAARARSRHHRLWPACCAIPPAPRVARATPPLPAPARARSSPRSPAPLRTEARSAAVQRIRRSRHRARRQGSARGRCPTGNAGALSASGFGHPPDLSRLDARAR